MAHTPVSRYLRTLYLMVALAFLSSCSTVEGQSVGFHESHGSGGVAVGASVTTETEEGRERRAWFVGFNFKENRFFGIYKEDRSTGYNGAHTIWEELNNSRNCERC